MYYYISTNAYDYVATPDYCKPHGYKTFTVDFDQFDPRDYVMLCRYDKRVMKNRTFADVEAYKRDLWDSIEYIRDRAAQLFILDQFGSYHANVTWDEVDGDIQDLLDGAEWYIEVEA